LEKTLNNYTVSEPDEHYFGGNWTSEKLERLRKYLVEYSKIMAKQKFIYAYIDAFAGTGYISKALNDENEIKLFQDLVDDEPISFINGSVKTALEVHPPFSKYIFIEKDIGRVSELKQTCDEYPEHKERIQIVNADANMYLQDLCDNRKWGKHRAVLFLDPYGMQVEWKTIESIARTKAIDMWLLFPLGMSINRMLTKSSEMPQSWEAKLDRFFGTHEWKDAFYKQKISHTLFGEESEMIKACNYDAIGMFFVERLRKVFPAVAENPLTLCNSRNVPLFLFCFAAGNEKGGAIAKRIAEYILGNK
jgi:three-Cys-motif partner protein